MEPELNELLERARSDPEAVALVLFGSACGLGPRRSDLDISYVLSREPLPARERRGRLEVVPTTLGRMRKLCVAVREQAAERGYADVYEGWNGDIDRVLAFRFG